MSSEGAFAEFLEEYLVEEAKNRGRSVSFGEQGFQFRKIDESTNIKKFLEHRRVFKQSVWVCALYRGCFETVIESIVYFLRKVLRKIQVCGQLITVGVHAVRGR